MRLMLAGVAVIVALLALVSALRSRRGAATVIVAAEPEAALLSSAAALRRLGARITRYDSETSTLEARAPTAGIVRLRAAAHDGLTTRVDLEGDAHGVIRRFRRTIVRVRHP
jgi:Tfp pilus assembly protein PilN